MKKNKKINTTKVKILKLIVVNEIGSALLTSVALISLFMVILNVSMKFYASQRSIEQGRKSSVEAQIIAHDLAGALSDSTNCSINFKKIFKGNLTQSVTEESKFNLQSIDNISKTILSVGTSYNGATLKSAVLTSMKPNSDNPPVYTGEFSVLIESQKGSTGVQAFTKRFNLQINLKDDASGEFKSCRLISAKNEQLELPICGDRQTLVFNENGELSCSGDRDLAIPANVSRYEMACLPNEAVGRNQLFGKPPCATLNYLRDDTQAFKNRKKSFWVPYNSDVNVKSDLPKISDGMLLKDFFHTASVDGTAFLETIIPVKYHSKESVLSYDAAFIGLVFYSDNNGASWNFAGAGDIWNPFSAPAGKVINGKSIQIGHDFGGSAIVTASFPIKKNVRYSVAVKVMSFNYFNPGNVPLWFGSMRFDHNYATGAVLVTEMGKN